MAYTVITKFPKEENVNDAKYITNQRKEMTIHEEQEDVIRVYEDCLRQGYDVNVAYKTPENDEESNPFDVAERLTASGIDYKASLKVKNSGDYDDIIALAKIIEGHGFDFNLGITLKINEDSPVNIDHEDTWMGEDATYKVTPKAASTNINDLHGLYTSLDENGYDVKIDIKPKKNNDDDDDFATQLAAYPEDTEITFTLKDSEY